MNFAPQSDAEFSEFGRWVIEHYERPFTIRDGETVREISGYEMIALHAATRELACEKRDREGCCGVGEQEGRCYGCGGWCPKVTEARQAESFCEAFLKWINKPEGDDDDEDRDGTEEQD